MGGPRFYKSLDLQKQVFQRVLMLCDQTGGKILTIYSVRTATTVLDMIEKHLRPNRNRAVLHWFTGSKAEAHRAIDLGCYFSINAEMFKSDRHRSTISSLPLDRLLTETDGPFCKKNGLPVHPKDVVNVVELLAIELRMSPDAIGKIILSNFNTLIE